MATLADFTCPALIIPHLRGQDVTSVIEELSRALHREARVPDFLPFYQSALNREFLVKTDVESGMAFPHARLPEVEKVSFAFGQSNEPIDWGSRGTHTVKCVFLLAVPATDSTQYLALISGLTRLSKQTDLLELLRTARDQDQILSLFQRIMVRTDSLTNMPVNSPPRPTE